LDAVPELRYTVCDRPEGKEEELNRIVLDAAIVGIPVTVAVPCGTKTTKLFAAQEEPVACPIVTAMLLVPCAQLGLLQRYPELAMQVVPRKDDPLKTPKLKSAPRTTAMMSMAHP
jgi:hypothetical protein